MKRFKVKKMNNDGAALIFVIVVVMFITILTTLLLYVATMNFQMKATDYHTRVSFYGAEIPLEELRMQMAVDTAQAAEVAYKSVMQQYSALATNELRTAEYQKLFFQEIETIWATRTNTGIAEDWCAGVLTALGGNAEYEVIDDYSFEPSAKWHIVLESVDVDPTTGTPKARMYREEDKGRIILHNVCVTYTENDFTSVIATDLCINVPEMDWSVNKYENPTGGISDEAAEVKEINFEEFVTYLDWEKR